MQKEQINEWKSLDFLGYPDYEVSNWGQVKSLKRGKERILKYGKGTNGYLFIILSKDGKEKIFYIHRLVGKCFLENPDNLLCVNHKDENKENNHVSNLEWCTHKYNNNYGTKPERISEIMKGKISHKRKCILQYSKKGEFIKEWESIRTASKELNINDGDICNCCKGKLKSAGKYIWKYKE